MEDKINLDDQAKLQILLSAANERYKSIHIMRERVRNTCTWALGIIALISGWLIQSNLNLDFLNKLLYTVLILVSLYVIRCYLKDIEKGFSANLRVVAKIEKILMLYDSNVYDNTGSCVYPKQWSNAGSYNSEGQFFKFSYWLLYLGIILLLFAIWFG